MSLSTLGVGVGGRGGGGWVAGGADTTHQQIHCLFCLRCSLSLVGTSSSLYLVSLNIKRIPYSNDNC